MQIHYPGPQARDDGEFGVSLNPGDGDPFVRINLSDSPRPTFLFADEGDVDRLLRAARKAKSLLEAHRLADGGEE